MWKLLLVWSVISYVHGHRMSVANYFSQATRCFDRYYVSSCNYISASICSDGSLQPASCRQTGDRALRGFAWCMSLNSQVVTKMSTGAFCFHISWRSESLYFVLTIDCRVHCKMSSQGEQSGNPSCLCASVSTVRILFLTSSGLSVNHYLEKKTYLLQCWLDSSLKRRARNCVQSKKKKKKKCVASNKSSFSLTNKNISVKTIRLLCVL